MQTTLPAKRNLVLRADVLRGGKTTVGHTVEVSAERLLVRAADVDPPGAQVTVRLSFPRVLEPLTLTGTVVALRDPHVYERMAAMSIELRADGARERLVALLGSWQARALPAPREGETTRVLVADRSSIIREMFAYAIRRFFQPRAVQVIVDGAADGEAAWRALQGGGYDLAILDLRLPGIGAAELVARMRGDAALEPVPVVVTGDGSTAPIGGADLYLDKPVILKDVIATLEQLTASRKPTS